jgi:hypothetical protein
LTVNTGNAKVGVRVIVGVGVKLGAKVSVGVGVFVNVGVSVGVSVYVGVKVFVQEEAVLVAAAEACVATCSALGPQATSEIINIPINDNAALFKGRHLHFLNYMQSGLAGRKYPPYKYTTILTLKGDP